jgi:galactitol-specific phosphotransferase system IIC component
LLEKVTLDNASSFLNKAQLMKLRLKAMRAGVWFRVLPRIDRVLVDLTIRVASSIRSVTLAKNILVVVRKLEGLLESSLSRALREVGFPLAQKLSLVAQKWGNASAGNWASDSSFAFFLAVLHINNPKTFKP